MYEWVWITIISLAVLATSMKESMKVVSAKLLLSCLNDYSMDYDGFTENNPAYIYEDHLSYINSCFGKINYEYILGALNISYVKYLNAILNTEHFYLSLVYKLINSINFEHELQISTFLTYVFD